MAGIGFELKKLFVGRGAIRKARAYAYASIVCSGTMLLAVVLLLGVQQLAKSFGTPERERETLVVLVVYAMLFSMLLSAALQTFLSRYVADQIYQERPERVMPSLFGGSLLLMVPGGLLYGLLLSRAPQVALLDRALNWLLFMELIPVWLQMAYITAAKDYRRILFVFAAGVGCALLLGGALLLSGASATRALLAALVCGYGLMLLGFTQVLLRYFPAGGGSLFAFVGEFGRTGDLMLTGFLGMAGAFVHLTLMWFSPLGESVAGPFRQASTHDAAAFFAFLVTLPANVNFVVSVEVNFYEHYRRYFGAITGGGTIGEISVARAGMTAVLKQEIFKLSQVQIFFMVLYIVLMRYVLKVIGFTTEMIAMFQIMSIGYSAFAIGNCTMLLQLYFNDRRGALASCAAFFLVNLAVTLLTVNGPPLYYGTGLVAAGVAMYLVSLPRLLSYVKRIDYHVFCSQPVVAEGDRGFWPRLAARLETGRGKVRPQSTNGEVQA